MKEENKFLRDYNEEFGDENDRLIKENDSLKKEIAKYRVIRISTGRKRSKSCPEIVSPDASSNEQDKARVRFFTVEFCYY